MSQKDLIALEIKNNSSLPIDIKMLQGVNSSNLYSSKNLYEYNFSAADYTSIIGLTIIYYLASEPLTILQKNASVLQKNIQGVVDALNSMGIGIFFSNGNIIYSYSDVYIYSTIAFI
jgi:hypothetical protein